MLASMIFRRDPFFCGCSNSDQLLKIAKVLGTRDLYRYLAKYKIRLTPYVKNKLGTHSRKEWQSFVNDENKHLVSPEAFDLLDGVLRYDHQRRLTAKEAMAHPYFCSIAETQGQTGSGSQPDARRPVRASRVRPEASPEATPPKIIRKVKQSSTRSRRFAMRVRK